MFLSVPIGTSLRGWGTGTVAGLEGCFIWWWDPLMRSTYQPSSSSRRITSCCPRRHYTPRPSVPPRCASGRPSVSLPCHESQRSRTYSTDRRVRRRRRSSGHPLAAGRGRVVPRDDAQRRRRRPGRGGASRWRCAGACRAGDGRQRPQHHHRHGHAYLAGICVAGERHPGAAAGLRRQHRRRQERTSPQPCFRP